ncbi:MAG TPA: HAMP domain-containing sensor histidine kinase [Bacteroidales bacterium]|nr:HAMP domain-containing sensor histidine kinase [Bacteroidales bacterium]
MFTYSSHKEDSGPDKKGTNMKDSISYTNNNILGCPKILAGLSHEVRTYMNSIVAFSFLINDNNCTEIERNEYNNHVLNSCEQLITLFDNFLDSAIIDSEQPRTNLTKHQLKIVLEELAIELNSSLKRFDRENVSLILDEQAGSFTILFDEEKIIRVIKNLFYNALQNTSSGYIKLGYKVRDKKIIFYVIDSGNGYHSNRELLASVNLTEHLVKHSNTFTTVGLILANQLVINMDGELWVEPNGVSGTGMYFSIPMRDIIDQSDNANKSINSRISV